MTSPVGGKPESTQDRYNDVHSVGSSFGAELDEDSVRGLLGNQVENPFFSIVTGLANTVVDILESVAKGIAGIFSPGAKEAPIRNAIIAVMEPMESQVFELGKRLNDMSAEAMEKIEEQAELIRSAETELSNIHTLLQEQKDYEEATREALNDAEIAIGEAEAWMGINEEKIDEAQNKALASHQILFNEQTGWNKTQEKITESLVKSTEANTQALSVQSNLNKLFQEQLWAQLDMIEQLELQSPRVYHQNVDDGPLISNIPSWLGWDTAREYKNTFINFYHRYSDTKSIKWQATGRWEGQVRLTTNWDNGAVDVYVYTIHKNSISRGDKSWSGRTFSNGGGAAFVYHRNTTFEVYPKHLGRWFNLFWKPEDERWYHSTTALDIRGVEGGPSILRWDQANAKENPGIRLATSFSCNQPLTLVDMAGKEVTYQPGETINPQIIDVNRLDKSKQYRFEEVGIHW